VANNKNDGSKYITKVEGFRAYVINLVIHRLGTDREINYRANEHSFCEFKFSKDKKCLTLLIENNLIKRNPEKAMDLVFEVVDEIARENWVDEVVISSDFDVREWAKTKFNK